MIASALQDSPRPAMTTTLFRPVDDLIKDIVADAGKEMASAIALAYCGETGLAVESARRCQKLAHKAKEAMATALKHKRIFSPDEVYLALGWVEDSRLFANASIVFSNHSILWRLASPQENISHKKLNEAVGYMVTSIEILHDLFKGGCPMVARKKLSNAVTIVTELTEEKNYQNVKILENTLSAVNVIHEIAKRTENLVCSESKGK
jgi:hypothetical protein